MSNNGEEGFNPHRDFDANDDDDDDDDDDLAISIARELFPVKYLKWKYFR